MKLIRRLFINRRNGQASLTIPKSVVDRLQENLKVNKQIKKISLEILDLKEVEKIR